MCVPPFQCWETFFGQEFYKLGLINFVASFGGTVFYETARKYGNPPASIEANSSVACSLTVLSPLSIASRFKWKGLGQKLGKAVFDIPKSILDLIYTQALLW